MKRLGTMFPDILRSLFHHPVTEHYPDVRPPQNDRLRGLLQWDAGHCTGCGLCAMDCPSEAILLNMLDRKEKRFYLTYHIDRCLFCGQCVLNCRQGSLEMAPDKWELASLDKRSFVTYFGEPVNVEQHLAGKSENQPCPTG